MPTIKSIIQTLFIGLKKYVPKGKLAEYENEYWSRKNYDKKFADRFFPKYIAFEKWAKKPKNKIDILLLNYWIYDVPEVGLTSTRLLKIYIKEYDKILHKHAMAKMQAFKNVMEKRKPKYLNDYHRKNNEAGIKQKAEWKKSTLDYETELKRQKAREKEAKELEYEYLTKAHQENSEKAIKQIAEWKNSPTDSKKVIEQMKKNSKDMN